MKNKLTVYSGISELLTLEGAAKKQGRNVQESDLSVIPDGVIAAFEGQIVWIGPRSQFHPNQLPAALARLEIEDIHLNTPTVLPAFVECHTHLIFAGSRAHEFEWRMQGETYQEIAAKGGGILSTVKATRAASDDELRRLAQARIDTFRRQGVTTVEIKSGYGLDLESEIRILRVGRSLKGADVVNTFLGPHSRSPDFADLKSYMDDILERALPRVVSEKLADRADIYIEKGFFDLEQSRRYFKAVQATGLAITAHVEQLSDFGGTDLALGFSPASVDHAVFVNEATIDRLAKTPTVAVLLPASDLYLKMRYPPARSLIDRGARVALSTDYNPGTSPTQDLSLIGVLGRLEMKMSLPEVIVAWTLNSAAALGRETLKGSLSAGKSCDFICLDSSWRELFYSVGTHPVTRTVRGTEIT